MQNKRYEQKKVLRFLAAFLVVVLFICLFVVGSKYFLFSQVSSQNTSFHPNAWKFADTIETGTLYPVEHVIDGDTFIARIAGVSLTVRLIGMDTPETLDPRKPVECYGPEASAEAKRIFGAADGVASTSGVVMAYLEKDPVVGDYDKYGRILAYARLPPSVAFPNGLFYNQYMIENGFAREYTYMKQVYKYQSDFRQAQADAKKSGRGVWNTSVCQKPFNSTF